MSLVPAHVVGLLASTLGCASPPVVGAPDSSILESEAPEFPREADGGVSEDGACEVPALWQGYDASCHELRVDCGGLPSAPAGLLVVHPPAGTPVLGTVLFGVGGVGVGHYSAHDPAQTMMGMLVDAGYVVVDRSWTEGWFGSSAPGGGLGSAACRYATLLEWVHAQIHDEGGFCATGNSGGSAELAFALTWWGAAELLDQAVLTSGPPLSRVDLLCLGDEADASWGAQCAAIWDDSGQTCADEAPVCSSLDRPEAAGPAMIDVALESADSESACTGRELNQLDRMLGESALATGSLRDFPETRVDFLFGEEDCTEAVPLGYLLHASIESATTVTYVADMPHEIMDSVPGQQALMQALLEGCR